MGAQLGRVLRERLQQTDPYQEAKRAANAAALACCPRWESEVTLARDPLYHALRLAGAGNSLDLGVHTAVDSHLDVNRAPPGSGRSDYEPFRAALDWARQVLFLADNTGEILLDRILFEEFVARGKQVTVAVHGGPTLNDVTTDDVQDVGLNGIAEGITTGADVRGVFLAETSVEFQDRFRSAELIGSKGMGDFEGLSEERAPLFFLLQAKGFPVAEEIGVPTGDLVLLAGHG